jgi:hypothetical protein
MYIISPLKYSKVGREKNGTAVNAACQENLLAGHFVQACHKFVSTDQWTVKHVEAKETRDDRAKNGEILEKTQE